MSRMICNILFMSWCTHKNFQFQFLVKVYVYVNLYEVKQSYCLTLIFNIVHVANRRGNCYVFIFPFFPQSSKEFYSFLPQLELFHYSFFVFSSSLFQPLSWLSELKRKILRFPHLLSSLKIFKWRLDLPLLVFIYYPCNRWNVDINSRQSSLWFMSIFKIAKVSCSM